ncbi:MAG: hypothetical protein QF795_03995 [Candidatus Marinimicrobia bacterium]|nr:hypothetical protein [Candidatus Neomarinimicrobiota bacterium]
MTLPGEGVPAVVPDQADGYLRGCHSFPQQLGSDWGALETVHHSVVHQFSRREVYSIKGDRQSKSKW